MEVGVGTCSGESMSNFTNRVSTRVLSNELFFKFTYSLLSNMVFVIVLNAASLYLNASSVSVSKSTIGWI